MAKHRKGLEAAPEDHATRIKDIHEQIERGLREASNIQTAGLTKRQNGCRIFNDSVRALEHRAGRAQGHLDGIAGSPAATTAMFKAQKRLESKIGTLNTKFKRVCMKGS